MFGMNIKLNLYIQHLHKPYISFFVYNMKFLGVNFLNVTCVLEIMFILN